MEAHSGIWILPLYGVACDAGSRAAVKHGRRRLLINLNHFIH